MRDEIMIRDGRFVQRNYNEKKTGLWEVVGSAVLLVVALHMIVLAVMIIGIIYQPEAIQHTVYWDKLLSIIVQ